MVDNWRGKREYGKNIMRRSLDERRAAMTSRRNWKRVLGGGVGRKVWSRGSETTGKRREMKKKMGRPKRRGGC